MFRKLQQWFRNRFGASPETEPHTTEPPVLSSQLTVTEPDQVYTALTQQYMLTEPQLVGHVSTAEQHQLFRILMEIGVNIATDSILDVGCGVADLYGYIGYAEPNRQYLGIDRNLNMVQLARQKYPDAMVVHIALSDLPEGQVDWCLANSIFNLPYTDTPYKELYDGIELMWQHAGRGVAFNCLSDIEPESQREPGLFYFNATQVFQHCLQRYGTVILRHDYLENDFTVYIYK
jgi:SAM-dependent methyltransferase